MSPVGMNVVNASVSLYAGYILVTNRIAFEPALLKVGHWVILNVNNIVLILDLQG
jgi:hypothetical protein